MKQPHTPMVKGQSSGFRRGFSPLHSNSQLSSTRLLPSTAREGLCCGVTGLSGFLVNNKLIPVQKKVPTAASVALASLRWDQKDFV